jgi:uncharacterized Zn ribbon protein
MTCPNCGVEASFTEHSATSMETHGLDCGPYEYFTGVWLVCDRCESETTSQEVERTNAEALF